MRTALLVAALVAAVPARPLAEEPAPPPVVVAAARPADLSPPPPQADPLVWALQEEPVLARRAGTGRSLRRVGAGLMIAGAVAVPVGLLVVLDGMARSFEAGRGSPRIGAGGLVMTAGFVFVATGAGVYLTGSARREDAAQRWNGAHPERPLHP